MAWPLACLVVLIAAAAIHLRWRARARGCEAALHREIDQLRSARQEILHRAESEQEALLNSMVEGALLLDETGRVQIANHAFADLFGVSADLRSRTILEAIRLHELADLVASLNATGTITGHELRVSRPRERALLVNGAAILDAAGQRHGAILLFHDVTRLKQLERTREEFVANVSHELRTPLSLIKGYTETLLDGAKDKPEVATKFLETINRNAERLQRLMDDLLAISELESGRMKLNLQPVSLRALVDKVTMDLAATAGKRKVTLVNECATDLRAQADPYRLEQVLSNLLGNAIKYGRQEGRVVIRARPVANSQIETCVVDDGPGIPADALERVFERFYRVDKSRSREMGGTGLGLSIVKHIVQNHGGKVWVESPPGEGARFFFTLPTPPV